MKEGGSREILAAMLEKLVVIKPMEWAGYAFSREPLNNRFTDTQRQKWMEQSLRCGKEYANKIQKEFESADPEELAKDMGINVFYRAGQEETNRILFAEFREPDEICIYTSMVEKANEFLVDAGISAILSGQVNLIKVLLAHELFHYMEGVYKKEIFTQTERFEVWSVGPFHYRTPVMILSEIAAMAFARELTGLSYAPYVIDLLLLYPCFQEEACRLYGEMLEHV